jgi:hypothetical protein
VTGLSKSFRARVLLALLCLAVGIAVLSARVRDVRSDPRATLVAAQVALTHGTLALDSLGTEKLRDYDYVLTRANGHFYSRFPLGSTIAALPAAALATAAGLDLSLYENERLIQVLLAAGIAVGNVLLLTAIARLWLTPRNALVTAAAMWFGTSFASTEATALWSHDFASLFGLIAIFASLRADKSGSAPPGYGIGLALFAAYLCRPTLSLLVPFLLVFVFLVARREALKAAAVVAFGLALFMAWSLRTFGKPFPEYYGPERLAGSDYLVAVVGNLVSPSRGLLVFSPILLLPLFFLRDVTIALKASPKLLLIAGAWPLAHFLLVSRLHHWWGGYSFGPRFMTDLLPGLFLLLCLCVRGALERKSRLLWPVFGVLTAVSCAINTGQGLYNHAPKAWNAEPNIDEHPELVFDWRYPQFLNTDARQRARVAELHARGVY